MPSNECIPYYEDSDRITGQCAAPVIGKRFVAPVVGRASGPLIPASPQTGSSDPYDGGNIMVQHAAAQGIALGVSSWDGATGDKIGVISEGIVPVTCVSAITAGQAVEVGVNGQCQPVTTGNIAGTAIDSALAGADAQIRLRL